MPIDIAHAFASEIEGEGSVLYQPSQGSSCFECCDTKPFSFPFLSLQWLNEARIIQRLVELIHSSQDEDVSMARLEFLCLWAVGPAR